MIIKIENFANISHLEIPLIENKLNFLYGISGSGKSSIAKALTLKEEEYEKYKTFGCTDEVLIESDSNMDFKIFDNQAIHEFIIAKSGAGVYDVLYGENEALKEIKSQLNLFLKKQDLVDVRHIISNQHFLIEQLEKELGLKRTGTGGLSKTGFFKTLSNSKDYVELSAEMDIKEKTWIKEGYSYIEDDICPFCKRKMTSEIIDELKKIVNELPKEYQTLANSEKLLKNLDINIDVRKINDLKVQNELKEAIENKYSILKEMDKIEDALSISISDDKSLSKKVDLKISDDVIEIFKEANIDIDQIIEQLKKDKEGYTLNKKKYNSILRSIIKTNINEINNYIDYFGIKYEFIKSDILSHDVGYSLVHKQAENDTSEFLSTGEKNVISLILFLISYKSYDIIIDDPASSYDEYRREQILKFIFKIMYKDNLHPKTALILSHDQIFLKFLSKYMKNNDCKNIIGEVIHIENINGKNAISKIGDTDMDTIMNHILAQCKKSKSYVQRIINLRLFYEITSSKSLVYKYLSAILHCNRENLKKEELVSLLEKKNISEAELLNKIKNDTEVELEYFDPLNVQFDMDTLTKFEKLCLIREDVTKEKQEELNNVVHFNYALQHLLNPYKFNFQSEKCYSILDSYEKK